MGEDQKTSLPWRTDLYTHWTQGGVSITDLIFSIIFLILWIPAPRLRGGMLFTGMTGYTLDVIPAKAGIQNNLDITREYRASCEFFTPLCQVCAKLSPWWHVRRSGYREGWGGIEEGGNPVPQYFRLQSPPNA